MHCPPRIQKNQQNCLVLGCMLSHWDTVIDFFVFNEELEAQSEVNKSVELPNLNNQDVDTKEQLDGCKELASVSNWKLQHLADEYVLI